MSAASVLRALCTVTGAQLKYFSLVRCSISDDPTELYYLCFGKHALFLVDREMDGPARDGQLLTCPYTCLERCEVALDKPEVFVIYFLEGTPMDPANPDPSDTFPEALMFKSFDRERLLSELETYFRTDYMFQHWTMPTGGFVVDVPGDDLTFDDESDEQPQGENLAPDLRLEHFGNYKFCCPKTFELRSDSGRGSTVAKFVDTTDPFADTAVDATPAASFEVMVHGLEPINRGRFSLNISGEKDVAEVADFYVREIAEQVSDYRIIGVPRAYVKVKDENDIAQVRAWKVYLRTAGRRHDTARSQALANRDICIIVMQRKYIPPMMDKFQNIVVITYGSYGTVLQSSANEQRCEAIVNSLSVISRAHGHDSLVVQTRANTLMLDEEAYAWYATNLSIKPDAHRLARAFCLSIVRVLSRAGLQVPVEAGVKEGEVSDDPFEFSLRLERQVPGVADQGRDNGLVREWKARVWRYLAFCVDGGILPYLTIIKLAVHVQQHPRRLQRLSQVLQVLLYFRAANSEFSQVALPLKVSDDRLMQNFTFNELVMERLLSSGYIKKVLDDTTDPLEYPRFIVRLLQQGKDRVRWGYSLQYTVCKQLVRSSAALSSAADSESAFGQTASGAEVANLAAPKAPPLGDLALHTIVPALIDLLNDEGSNEKIQVLVVSTLVNFTKNNTIIKNKIMAGGGIRRICQFLYSKHDDLVRHSCSLLNNCTKSEQYRGQVAKFRAVEALMRLLNENPFPPRHRSTRILIQACVVIGNLASDTVLRQRITDSLGYEFVTDGRDSTRSFPQSRAIRVLFSHLGDGSDTSKERESLRVTVIFSLKNLAIRHAENKRTIGRLAIPQLCTIVKSTPDEPNNRILIDVALRCIYVLSFDPVNCRMLQIQNIDKILQRLTAFADITRQIHMKLNKST